MLEKLGIKAVCEMNVDVVGRKEGDLRKGA